MKKLFIVVTGFLGLLFVSCKKDFLERNPNDQISSETFWKTDADIDMAVTGVYNIMTDRPAFNHGRKLWDGLSDIGYLRDASTLGQHNIEATSGGMISGIYNNCYQGISRANIFLANVDKAEASEGKKTMAKAEVYFLRASFYFILTEFYGGVPLYTAPVTIEESKVKQSSKAAVVEQILQDIELAVAGLPDELYTGRAVKGSALALKAQVLMHNEKWAEAADAANEIISAGKFQLYNNFKDLFLSVGQENNPEIIFSVRYLNPDASMPTTTDMNADLMGAHAHTLSATRKFVDAFECTDGLPISQSPLYDPSDISANRDPRLFLTIRKDKYIMPDGSEYNGETWGTEYSLEKSVNWENAPYSWATRSDQDFILFRYAQVLLIYAESRNEASGPDQSVYDAVNAIRARPGINMPPLPAGLDQEGMRARIRNERLVELGLEGLRYWDIKRWKIAETVIPEIVDISGVSRTFNPAKHYLFPFAQSELDINPNLEQNPGY